MKYLKQIAILLAVCAIGQALELWLGLPVPGVVIGLLLLFGLLRSGIIKAEMIEDVSHFLLSNMAFFFIPAGVGLIASFSAVREVWFAVLLIIIVSTAVVWLVTALTVRIYRRGKSRE